VDGVVGVVVTLVLADALELMAYASAATAAMPTPAPIASFVVSFIAMSASSPCRGSEG
jgi:hypothetical protein